MKICGFPRQLQTSQEHIRQIFSEIEKSFSPGSDDYSSSKVLYLFNRSLQIYNNSNGLFDISIGPLSRIWGFRDKNYRIPDDKEIKSVLKYIGMDNITIKNNKIIVPHGVELDWGAIAKGFAIDLASKSLISLGVSSGFINAGGDLYCWGKNPDGRMWNIGIKHPRRSGFLGALSITNLGAATTGDYQRYFERNNVRYQHVFDPHTGHPAIGKQSVTVMGPETLVCDALSTAIFVSDEIDKILINYPEYGAIIVDNKGKIYNTGKLYKFFKIK